MSDSFSVLNGPQRNHFAALLAMMEECIAEIEMLSAAHGSDAAARTRLTLLEDDLPAGFVENVEPVLAQLRVDLRALSTRLGLETRRMSRAHSIQALASSEIVRIEDSYSPTLHGYGAVHEDAAKVIDPALNRLHAGFVAIRALLRRR